LRYTMVGCGAVIFTVQGLHWLGAIEFSPDLNPYLKWPLTILLLVAVVVTWLYILLVFFSAMWHVATKQFRLSVGKRCQADVVLIAKLAQFDEAGLFPLARAAAMRERIFEGRERLLFGFLDKVPLLAVILVSALALQVQAVQLPAQFDWIGQWFPAPLSGMWIAVLGGLFTALRVPLHYGREDIRAYAGYLDAALEHKKGLVWSRLLAAAT